MKKCNYTFWLGLSPQDYGTDIVISNRVRYILHHIPNHDVEYPRFLVVVGNETKTAALRELFGAKRARRRNASLGLGELHLHLDASSVLHYEPLLIAEGDVSKPLQAKIPIDPCHELTRRTIRRSPQDSDPARVASGLYSQLLYPFADVFCFFSEDVGGLEQVACHLTMWLEQASPSRISTSTKPRAVIVVETVPGGGKGERQARKHILQLVRQKTTRKLLDYVSAVDIIALSPRGPLSLSARHRLLKERLMNSLDQAHQHRIDAQFLFSTAHLAAFLDSATEQFADAIDEPFSLIRASRLHNPVAGNLEQHISTFLAQVKTSREMTEFAAPIIASSLLMDNYPPGAPFFPPNAVFQVLYEDILSKVSTSKVISFDQSGDFHTQSGLIAMVRKNLEEFARVCIREKVPSATVHRNNLFRHRERWRNVQSSSTCLSCLRRGPQFRLDCGHVVCENCAIVFGEANVDDPWVYTVTQCFLCQMAMPRAVVIRTHPPTAGAGVLCIDGGGIRGIAALKFLEKINARIGLPIPFQRFIKIALGVSSGGLIVADLFLNGSSVEQSTERFKLLAKTTFQRRGTGNVSFLPRFVRRSVVSLVGAFRPLPTIIRSIDLLLSCLADGLYPSHHIENALKQVFGAERGILDYSHATSTGTRVALPVATVDTKPSCRLFTNYNGVGERKKGQDHVMKPKDGLGKALLWEIARAASAAPGFFSPKHVGGVGTFQDAGPLENNPLLSALSEVAALFPLVEEPDFVVSLGTGEPEPSGDLPTSVSRNVWKNGAFPRLCRLFWEKMRDKKVSEAFQAYPRYHRLNIQFDGDEPRLDDPDSIPEIEAKVQGDETLSRKIDTIARCFIASLFYFELDAIPERSGGRYVGTGHVVCALRRSDPAFRQLLDRLSGQSAQLWMDGSVVATVDNTCLGSDGNFRKRVELNTEGRFAISLQQDTSEPCNISGSPFSIEKLVLQQGLNAVFGRPDHRKRKSLECSESGKKRRRFW